VDSSVVGVSTLGYPSGQAGPSEIGARSDVQVTPYSLATGIAETHALLELSSSSSRQPPAATETAAAQGLTLSSNVVNTPTRGTRRAPSVPARSSSSLRSLSPPVLSPAYGMEQSQSVLHRTGLAASSQRVASPRARLQRAPDLSPSQSAFSYGALSPPLGSDIEVEYPAVTPPAFQPKPLGAATDVDRAHPAAASVDVSADVGHMPLPYTDVDVCWPGSAAGPRQLESATSMGVRVHSVAAAQPTSVDVVPTFASAPTSAFTYVRPGTPIPSSVVDIAGQPSVGTPRQVDMLRGPVLPTVVDVPRPFGLTLSSVNNVVRMSVVSVDVARPAYGLAQPTAAEVARPPGPSSVDVVGPAYEPTLSITAEGVRLYAPPPVDVSRPSSVDVRRPMPYMGMRQPRSMKNANADEPSVGLTRSMRVGD